MRTQNNQFYFPNITASASSPYVMEKTIPLKSNYSLPAVQVLRFVTDELDGRWRLAICGIDYNVELFGASIMRIEIYASGSYRINY